MVFYPLFAKKNSLLNYLTVENISKSYGELTLFENLSFSVHKDQKIAFVAKNGTGKTSILNIISGEDDTVYSFKSYSKNNYLNFFLFWLESVDTASLN